MFCSKCGNNMADNAVFCSNCGQATYAAATPSAAVMLPAAAPVATAAPYVYLPPVQYAGFWLRFVAYIIDGLIMGVCFVAIAVALLFLTGMGSLLDKFHPGADPSEFGALLGVTFIFSFLGIAVVGSWLYHAYLESSDWQATVGKRVLNLKVTDMQGQPISFGRASGRFFAKIITSMIPLGIGYIIAGFTERKQAIHDMIANCLVLRTP
ncbi:MAG: RDD family protein [Candidatus Acidiferrum sp.]